MHMSDSILKALAHKTHGKQTAYGQHGLNRVACILCHQMYYQASFFST